MKQSIKGFTLLELLAVIVILAILLAIAIPSISGIIESARYNAFEDNAKLLIKTIETKQLADSNYDVTGLNVDNMKSDLGISNDNYQSISASLMNYKINIDIVGKNKWAGLEAHGTVTTLSIAYSPHETDGACFTFNNGTITGYVVSSSCPSDVVIPTKIDNVSVDYIGEYAFQFGHITSVVIPESVTSIGSGAFSFNAITNVVFSNSVTSIGDGAFQANLITNLVISNNVTSIGTYAFENAGITNLTIPGSVISIGDGAFENNQITSLNIEGDNPQRFNDRWTTIGFPIELITAKSGEACFTFSNGTITGYDGSSCPSDVVIPSTINNTSVTAIGEAAFQFGRITSVVIPDTVTTIRDGAFSFNTITSVIFSNSVTSIGSGAFQANQISSLTIPNSVTSIGTYAFENAGIESLIISGSVTSIGEGAFENNQITSLSIEGADPRRFNSTWTIIGFPSQLMP